jgi:hypothetical protein
VGFSEWALEVQGNLVEEAPFYVYYRYARILPLPVEGGKRHDYIDRASQPEGKRNAGSRK